MSAYAGLKTQLEKTIEAAIGAKLYEEGLREGSCEEGEFRGIFNITPGDGGFHNPVNMVLLYPSGEWLADDGFGQRVPFGETSWGRDGFAVPFEPIGLFNLMRGAVNGAFANYMDLPLPSDFNGAIGKLTSTAAQLNIGGAYIDGDGAETTIEADGGTELDILVSYVTSELTQFNGLMIDNLSKFYTNRLRPTVTGQFVAVCAAGSLIAGEQGLWEAAEQDVFDLAVEAEKGFDDLKNRHQGDPKVLLKAAGIALTAADLFFGATPAGPALAAAGGVVSIIDGLTPDTKKGTEVGLGGGSVDEVVANMRAGLDTINDTITAEEQALLDCGANQLGEIDSNISQFDISTPADFLNDDKGEFFGKGENLQVLMPHLRTIAANVQAIANVVDGEADGVMGAQGSGPWSRWSSVGLSYNGHYEAYDNLLVRIDELLRNSAKELRSVAERMVQVSWDFQATEDQVETELRQLTKQVESELAEQVAAYASGG